MKKLITLACLLIVGLSLKTIAQTTNLKGLLILIDFSDAPANVTVPRANNVVNGIGYTEPTVTASLRDYWYAQSRGKINLTHDVFGYFRAPQTAAWYKAQNWTEFLTLSTLALEWFKTNNPSYDWNSVSLSTTPGEVGTFLSVNFFTTAWIAGSGGTHWMQWTAPNGKKTGQITAQNFISPWDSNINLFWISHEQGHSVWSVPDTYDHDGGSNGDGWYSVMGGNQGNGQIESFGGPFLLKQGWVNVVDIQQNQSYTLTQDGNTVARYVNPNDPKEYFLIEARMKSTLGNEMIPTDRGLLIWHVDNNVTTGNDKQDMTQAAHYEYSIEQADGKFDLEHATNSADAGDYFVEGKTFSDNTIPSTKWWNGTSSNININNIKFLPNNQISFCNGTCTAINCTAGADSANWEYIKRVQFGYIDNTSAATTYSDFTAKSTSALRGSTMNLSVTIGTQYPADTILVWCDWNNDKIFDPTTELALTLNSTAGTNPYTGSIQIPANAFLGKIKMRIRMFDTGNQPTNYTPCGNAGYGEVEDYSLICTDNVTSIDPAGSDNQNGQPFINVYPSPIKDAFTLDISFPDNGNYKLEIANTLGQIVYSEALEINNRNYNYSKKLNLSDLSKGVYIIHLNGDRTNTNKKIIME